MTTTQAGKPAVRSPRWMLQLRRLVVVGCAAAAPVLVGLGVGLAIGLPAWWPLLLLPLAAAPAVVVLQALRRRRLRAAARARRARRSRRTTEQPKAFAPQSMAALRMIGESGPQSPLVTVVVPVRNEQAYLKDCLTSIAAQTFAHWRCIVVDDGSTDGSLDIAMRVAVKDARFSVIANESGHGLSAARNAGAVAATTPYVTFLDSDDALMPWSLEARLSALSDDPLQAGSYSDWFSARWDTKLADLDPGRKARVVAPTLDILDAAWDSPFIATAPVVRREVFLAVGGFDESLHTAEDMDFFARLLRGGMYFSYSRSVDVLYRTKQQSMIMRTVDDHLATVFAIAAWREQPAQPWAGAPMPYDEPLDVYLRADALFGRAVYNLGLAIASGATGEQLDASLSYIERLPAQIRRRPGARRTVDKRCSAVLKRLAPGARVEATAVRQLAAEVWERVGALDDDESSSSTAPLPDAPSSELAERAARYVAVGRVRDRALAHLETDEPVFLVCADSRYHVYEAGPLLLELRRRGVNARPVMMKAGYVDGTQRLDWGRYTDELLVGSHEDLDRLQVSGCFVLNDWSPNARALIDASRRSGGVSFAKVEGVQDFTDADTGRERQAYRTADVILAQGANDVESLPGMETVVVGSSRLEVVWAGGAAGTAAERAVVNFNFTYGVLADAQQGWIVSVVDVLSELGLDDAVSVHWAQKDLPADPRVGAHVGDAPFRHLITQAGVLISRFSTVPFEAMARGVPFVYFNPHGKKVPTFQQPDGAFLVATNDEELRDAVRTAIAWRADYRRRAEPFFRRQVDIDEARSSAERTADAIVARI